MVGRPDRFKKTCQVSVTVSYGHTLFGVLVDAELGELLQTMVVIHDAISQLPHWHRIISSIFQLREQTATLNKELMSVPFDCLRMWP
jgi:hypothetical protein